MKKTLTTIICTLTTVSSVFADVTIEQNAYDNAVVRDQHEFTLSELKQQLMVTMKQYQGLGYLTFDNVSLYVNDTSIFQSIGEERGGPFGVAFSGDVVLNFNEKLVFEDNTAGFMLAYDTSTAQYKEAHLTIDLQSEFLKGLEWGDDKVSEMYYYTFFKCQYFANMGDAALNFDVRLNGASKGTVIDGYTYIGYVTDPSLVKTGEIAVVPVSTKSEGWDGLMPGWNGQALSLVAKPQVGGNAPDIVPEPATGSLSLLALAGLCARRRRK